jgi:SAM-dependent methyltransferase
VVSDREAHRRKALELVAFAAASLYLELAIIRFTAAQVIYLGYFSNFVLLSAFVGLGTGFTAAGRKTELLRALPYLLLFLASAVLVAVFDVSFLRNRGGLFYFGNAMGSSGVPGTVLLPILFLTIAGLFAAIGQRIGRLFGEFEPLVAYSLDVGGSLLGIAIFSLQALGWSTPITWFLTGTALLALGCLLEGGAAAIERGLQIFGTGLATAFLLLASNTGRETVWSAYQKLVYYPKANDSGEIWANGLAHQKINPVRIASDYFYGTPYKIHAQKGGTPGRVLIIGAGSGTDVAVALASGAQSVDAVEIDQGIFELGQAHHPDHPYQDPRVTTHITDGREFLRRTDKTFDLILFALPDSLVLASSMGSVRLESYLFTLESFADAKRHLAPGGTFSVYNQYRWDWLRDRIGAMLAEVFGRPPERMELGDVTIFAVGEGIEARAPAAGDYEGFPTDDWPFLYMQRRGLHWAYIGMIAMFLVGAALGVGLLGPPGTLRRPDWPFFFMGVAFLLLETKSVSFFSLLFGTTWMVNSLAFAGILSSVLLANLVVQRFRLERRAILFAGLGLGIACAYLCPPALLLEIGSPALRAAAAIVVAFSPIFFANLIFSREFRDAEESTRAFGWNLIGAVAGGGAEYLSLLIGNRNLLLLVALCYGLSALTVRAGLRPARPLNG